MKFSLGKVDITPDKPIFMHGFGDRSHKSEGVLEPIYMKAALLQANQTLLIVTIDALGSDRSFIAGIKEALLERFGFAHDEVLINFSHTHHSVYLTGVDPELRKGGYSMGQSYWAENEQELDYAEDEAYFAFIRDELLRTVSSCFESLCDGELQIARGTSDFAVSRRRPTPEGGVSWQPYYVADIDKDLFVLKLNDTAGSLKGIIYSYGCHTTAMGSDNYLISNDFAGTTSAVLEEAYPGSIAMFLQGCAGELKPLHSAEEDRFIACDAVRTGKAGAYLAKDVITVMEQGEFTKVNCRFRTELRDPLLYTEQTQASFYERMVEDPKYNDFYRNAALRTIDAMANGTIKDRVPFYISVWQLDEETSLIAMEGEVSTEYSLLLKRIFGNGKMIVIGYTNGVFSYVPTRKMIGEGGYEAECNFFFGLRGPFVPEIEDIIVGQVAQALHRRA